MRESIRIGGAGGFWGDSPEALEQLVLHGDVQYVIMDYLAELTLAIMAKQKSRSPSAGFATDFVSLALKPVLREVHRRGIRIVTNAGGITPSACAEALARLAREEGVPLRIGIVQGDDLMPFQDRLRNENTTEMFTGAPLPHDLASMNAYIGAFPIAAALDAGADIVVTGRCADSALALGPLIHEFGWGGSDFDLLAAGSIAGHLVECGTQATGGLFSDWHLVKNRENLGYPIAECRRDGTFMLSKPKGTGGLVTPLVAAEQLLYELGDPRNYLLPDVTCDISDAVITQRGSDLVEISGVRGRAPTDTYKVSAIYTEGYRASATLTIVGAQASEKAGATGDAILARCRNILRKTNLGAFTEECMERLGDETAMFGANSRQPDPREVVLRLAVRHPERKGIEVFAREIAPFGTAGTPGTTGFSGRPKAQEVFRLYSFLIRKDFVPIEVLVDGAPVPFANPDTGKAFEAVRAQTTHPAGLSSGDCVDVPLRSVAIARSGDKADISHLAVIARDKALLPVLVDQLTEERVASYFAHLVKGRVQRYDVPGVGALSFLLHEALGGGGSTSLRSDALGKAFAEILLDMEIKVPRHLMPVEKQPAVA